MSSRHRPPTANTIFISHYYCLANWGKKLQFTLLTHPSILQDNWRAEFYFKLDSQWIGWGNKKKDVHEIHAEAAQRFLHGNSGENKVSAMTDSFSGSVMDKCAPGRCGQGRIGHLVYSRCCHEVSIWPWHHSSLGDGTLVREEILLKGWEFFFFWCVWKFHWPHFHLD